jgi:RNA methyltransferase, TrmH family
MISKSQLKHIQSLHQKKNRREEKLFLAEGVKLVGELLQQKSELIAELYCVKDFIGKNGGLIKSAGIQVNEISQQELERASALTEPNGAIAVCRFLPEQKVHTDFAGDFSLYLDDIRDPGNFGTMIRLADWFGVRQIYCSESSCELYNPKVIQASMGSFMRVDVKYISLQELVAACGIKNVYGALLGGKDLYEEKLRHGLIVIGNESKGISKDHLQFISNSIQIPASKESRAESLNAAMAASIITAEFFRQLRS